MGVFRYEAVDNTGKKLIGSMQAEDVTHVKRRLQTMGYQPTVIERSATATQRAPARPSPSTIRLSFRSRGLFYRSLATTLRSGMEAGEALGVIAQNTPNAQIRELCFALRRVVAGGRPLSEAMSQHPGVFESWQVGSLRAGELGGFADEIADRIASEYEKRGWFFEFMCILLWLSLVANVFVMVLCLPLFPILYQYADKGLGTLLPTYVTKLKTQLIPKAILWTLPLVILKAIMGTQREQTWYQRLSNRMPWVSRRYRVASLADFSAMLDRLLRSGIAPIQAWEAAAGSIRSAYYREPLLAGVEAVREGKGISQALVSTGLVDPEITGFIATAERSGRVTDALVHAGEVFRLEEKKLGLKLDAFRLHGLILGNIVVVGVTLLVLAYTGMNGQFDFVNKLMSSP